MTIRKMTIDDYEDVYTLWMSCAGMGLNNLDGDIGSVDKKELTFQQLGLRCVSKLRDLPRVLETYS